MAARTPKETISNEEPPKPFADENFLQASAAKHRKSLERQLATLYRQQGLTVKELLETHKQAQLLNHITDENFYETTVVSRSATLSREAKKVVAAITNSFEEDVITFCVDNRFYSEKNPERVEFFADIGSSAEVATTAITYVCDHQNSETTIDKIGRWWRNRLKEEATKKALPHLGSNKPHTAKAIIALAELELLVRSPWSVSERLLGAFEDVQKVIEAQLDERKEALLIYTRELG